VTVAPTKAFSSKRLRKCALTRHHDWWIDLAPSGLYLPPMRTKHSAFPRSASGKATRLSSEPFITLACPLAILDARVIGGA
jgi:hypothetical protein